MPDRRVSVIGAARFERSQLRERPLKAFRRHSPSSKASVQQRHDLPVRVVGVR